MEFKTIKIFTNRIESQKNFWASYDELINTSSTIINFYGAGDVGKMSLANAVANSRCSRREIFIFSSSRAVEKITEQQFKSWVVKSKYPTQIKSALELGTGFVDNAAAATLDVTSDALNIFPDVKTFAGLAGIIDKFMSKREHDKNLDSHTEIRD